MAKSMAYDDATYKALLTTGASLSGSAGAHRWTAFTDTLVKSISLKPYTAGTSNDVCVAYKVSGTTTTTVTLCTFGSAATAGTNVTTTLTLAVNEALSIAKGTDATGVIAVGAELAIVPGASITS